MCICVVENRLNLHAGPLIQQEMTVDFNAPCHLPNVYRKINTVQAPWVTAGEGKRQIISAPTVQATRRFRPRRPCA